MGEPLTSVALTPCDAPEPLDSSVSHVVGKNESVLRRQSRDNTYVLQPLARINGLLHPSRTDITQHDTQTSTCNNYLLIVRKSLITNEI